MQHREAAETTKDSPKQKSIWKHRASSTMKQLRQHKTAPRRNIKPILKLEMEWKLQQISRSKHLAAIKMTSSDRRSKYREERKAAETTKESTKQHQIRKHLAASIQQQ